MAVGTMMWLCLEGGISRHKLILGLDHVNESPTKALGGAARGTEGTQELASRSNAKKNVLM